MSTTLPYVVTGHALSNRREIIEALESAHEAGVEYWSGFSTPAFFAPIGVHWSPAEHVRHLTRSMTPLLPVLRVPRMALRLIFGRAPQQSRSLESLEAQYAKALAAGGTAGRYAPPPDHATGNEVRRNEIMDAHSETLRGLTQAMERWTESELDSCRLPHPLLGKLTVREMMLFTLLHNRHHLEACERRLDELS
jgi:hypothetical protein